MKHSCRLQQLTLYAINKVCASYRARGYWIDAHSTLQYAELFFISGPYMSNIFCCSVPDTPPLFCLHAPLYVS